MNLFQRAASYAPLQPLERAFLKLIETGVVAGIVAALPVAAQLLSQQQIDWATALRTAAATFGMAALLAGLKYAKAHMDPAQLSAAAASLLQNEAADSAL